METSVPLCILDICDSKCLIGWTPFISQLQEQAFSSDQIFSSQYDINPRINDVINDSQSEAEDLHFGIVWHDSHLCHYYTCKNLQCTSEN